MLQPLYDRYCNHVAWIEKDRFIFDLDVNWVAFIQHKQVWIINPIQWIGPINGVNCLDKEGRVVAWGPTQTIMGDLSLHRKPKLIPNLPEEPSPPMRPMIHSPAFPRSPIAGWSNLSFDSWLKG